MPELATKAFGKISVETEQILDFPEGLFGFNDHVKFALIEESEDSPFKWLQSAQEKDIAFIVIQPELFMKDKYVPDISRSDLELIEANSIEECIVLTIVTIPENRPENMTANLQGPVVINKRAKKGRQYISNNINHLVRVPILEQLGG